MAEEKAKRDEERAYVLLRSSSPVSFTNLSRSRLAEAAEKQRQREAEAAARAAERKNQPPPSRTLQRPSEREAPAAQTSERPRLNLAGAGGTGGGWREKEAAKLAAQSADVPADVATPNGAPEKEPSAPARSGGGYVPPSLRARQGADGASPRDSPRGETMPDAAAPGGDRWRSGGARPGPTSRDSGRGEENGSRYSAPRGFGPRDGASNRNASPAVASKDGPGRSFSSRGGAPERTASPATPGAGAPPATGSRYVPGAFKRNKPEQQ